MEITSFKNLTLYLKTDDLGPKLTDFNIMYDAAPGQAKKFASYMESTIKLLKDALPEKISDVWKSIKSFADIGGGSGYMAIQLCKHHPHLKGVSADLKQLSPVFDEYIAKENNTELAERVSFRAVDFFKDEMPSDVDALLFGNVLHDWKDSIKDMLIEKSFKALKSGGKIIIYDFFLDDDKCDPSRIDQFLMSTHMQLVTDGGSQFSFAEMTAKLTKAGFTHV
jgi:hypothetical protein